MIVGVRMRTGFDGEYKYKKKVDDIWFLSISPSLSLLKTVVEPSSTVNPGIGKCGSVCGDRVRRQNPPGNNVTNFAKSHDFRWTRLADNLSS
jgi:hypothetical protein